MSEALKVAYYGTKRVEAWPQEKDGKPGYAVQYADGYISWSPKVVFEAAYMPTTAMSFGTAHAALMDGHKVARASWQEQFPKNYLKLAAIWPFGPKLIAHFSPTSPNGANWNNCDKDLVANDYYIVE
jgi:hypothetical protein